MTLALRIVELIQQFHFHLVRSIFRGGTQKVDELRTASRFVKIHRKAPHRLSIVAKTFSLRPPSAKQATRLAITYVDHLVLDGDA
jgi:hypothetical protein